VLWTKKWRKNKKKDNKVEGGRGKEGRKHLVLADIF